MTGITRKYKCNLTVFNFYSAAIGCQISKWLMYNQKDNFLSEVAVLMLP